MPPTCWLINRRSEWPFSLTSSQAAATPLHKRSAGSSKPLAVMVNLFLIFSLSLGHYQLVLTGRDECKARSRSKLFQGTRNLLECLVSQYSTRSKSNLPNFACANLTNVVGTPRIRRGNRESGVNPELSRSGHQERKPHHTH